MTNESTQYIVNIRPLDFSERGSNRLRMKLAVLSSRSGNGDAEAMDELFGIIESRCYVPEDADYTIYEALDDISADDFDALLLALQSEIVGEVSDAS